MDLAPSRSAVVSARTGHKTWPYAPMEAARSGVLLLSGGLPISTMSICVGAFDPPDALRRPILLIWLSVSSSLSSRSGSSLHHRHRWAAATVYVFASSLHLLRRHPCINNCVAQSLLGHPFAQDLCPATPLTWQPDHNYVDLGHL